MSSSSQVKVSATSPALPAPLPPVIGEPVWKGRTVTFPVTMPTLDTEGQPIEGTLALRFKFGPAGFDPASVEWQAIDPANVMATVPAWATAYDFYFEADNG